MKNIRFVQPYTPTTYLHQEDVLASLRELLEEIKDKKARVQVAQAIDSLAKIGKEKGVGKNNAPLNPFYKGKKND